LYLLNNNDFSQTFFISIAVFTGMPPSARNSRLLDQD